MTIRILPPRASRLVASLVALPLALLAGCGGSGGGADGGDASVSNITASPVRYGATMAITVSGRNLGAAIELTVDGGCTDITRVVTTSEDTVQWTCVVRSLGEVVPRVRNSETRRELGSVKVNVPTPRVSITASDGARSGTFVMELDPVAAPKTVENFLAYVNTTPTSFYRSTLFHRVVPAIGVFGGGFTNGLSNSLLPKVATRPPVPLEAGLKNLRGTVAMFRGTAANSATSQFFINTSDNPQFDAGPNGDPAGYAVFGRVIEGINVVDEINTVPTGYDLGQTVGGVPSTPVSITAITQIR